ncbi:S1C family serine protease [Lysinimonas soli]|uniref:S1C family serine protease n=1 Tax=Lysinimonas soli TaxID=1074233 RepID=A0ABW0NKD1_9MICO
MPDSPQTPSDSEVPNEAPKSEGEAQSIEAQSTPAPTSPVNASPTTPVVAPAVTADAPSAPAADTAAYPAGTLPAAAPAVTAAKRGNVGPLIAALAVGAVLGGASGAGVAAWAVSANSGTHTTSSSPQTITVNNKDDVTTVTAVAAKASPSVVTVDVSASSEGGTGSGVVLSADGYVLTNTHVVTLDGNSANGTIEVTTYDGKLYKATVVGTDPIVDLAVIKLQGASGLQPIEFGDSSKINVGDKAIAIGAPLGLSNTVTDGIVSALNRSIQIASSAVPNGSSSDGATPAPNDGSSPYNFWNFNQNGQSGSNSTQSSEISLPVIQTDAPINPGNSGGALLNSSGKLIGINVAIASTGSTSTSTQSGSIGVGFAIPAELAKRISSEIIKTGHGSHGLLGASVQTATSDNSSVVGALIADVSAGAGADKAGLKKGDIVTSFNGVPITNSTDLTAQVRFLAPGSTAKLTYLRGSSSSTVDVTLGTLKS